MQNTCPAESKSTHSIFLALIAKRQIQVFQVLWHKNANIYQYFRSGIDLQTYFFI